MLTDLNLKLIKVVAVPAASPPAPALGPSPSPSPSPGGRSAVTDEASASGLSGSNTTPSGLMASVTKDLVAEEYESDDDYRWDGDESGFEFTVCTPASKSNNSVAFYFPSCNHSFAEVLPQVLHKTLSPLLPVASTASDSVTLSRNLSSIIERMSDAGVMRE